MWETIIYRILDIFLVLFFLKVIRTYVSTFEVEKKPLGKKELSAWMLYVGVQIWVVFTNASHLILNIVFVVLTLIYLCYVLGGVSLKVAVVKGSIFYSLWMMVEAVTISWFLLLGITEYAYSFMASSAVSKMLMYGVTQILARRSKGQKQQGILPKKWIRLLLIPAVSAAVFLSTYMIIQKNGRGSFFLVATAIAMLLTNYIVFDVYEQLEGQVETERENLLYAQQLDLCNRQAMERETAYQESRTLRHDLKNYLLDIKVSLAEGRIEEVQKKIDSILEKNSIYKNEVAKSGNLVLDALINYRYAVADARNIPMECRVQVPGELPYESADLCIILGNLLDNAMEAVEKLPEGKRDIELSMSMLKGNLKIMVSNPFLKETLTRKNGKIITSKEDKKNHGIGLASVCHAVDKYNGEMIISYEGNRFCVEILLYPPQQAILENPA